MNLRDSTSITYRQAEALDEAVLRRWLTWVIKGTPEEDRLTRENMGSKKDILNALVWMGAISSY